MENLSLQLELLEEVEAPSAARDFIMGFGLGLSIVGAIVGISFT